MTEPRDVSMNNFKVTPLGDAVKVTELTRTTDLSSSKPLIEISKKIEVIEKDNSGKSVKYLLEESKESFNPNTGLFEVVKVDKKGIV